MLHYVSILLNYPHRCMGHVRQAMEDCQEKLPQSPDVNFLNSFLWPHGKPLVCPHSIVDDNDLRNRIVYFVIIIRDTQGIF